MEYDLTDVDLYDPVIRMETDKGVKCFYGKIIGSPFDSSNIRLDGSEQKFECTFPMRESFTILGESILFTEFGTFLINQYYSQIIRAGDTYNVFGTIHIS